MISVVIILSNLRKAVFFTFSSRTEISLSSVQKLNQDT